MNFGVEIRIGYALGIYGTDSRDDLDIMRHVRNLFAHDKGHLMFEDSDVIALCDQLKWIDKYPWGGIVGDKPLSARKQYIETARHFFSYFNYAGVDVTDRRKPIYYKSYNFPWLYE